MLGAVGLLAAQAVMAGTIVGSKHDFTTTTWTTKICIACHTPHNADVSIAAAPLWNHTNSTAIYTPYTSSSYNGGAQTYGPGTLLCLSCHDGTIAMDAFGGAAGTASTRLTGNAKIGPDLRGTHPMGFAYTAASLTADPSLANPTTATVRIGDATTFATGTINAMLLIGTKLECSSCHDVHNTYTNGPKLVKMLNSGKIVTQGAANQEMCMACHKK